MENLKDLPVKKLIVRLSTFGSGLGLWPVQVTNSIDQTDRVNACGGMLGTIDIAPVIAESIRRTHNG
jgi:ribose-phosphate pyrophosphokinase